MISVTEHVLLFLPLFLAVNLCAAIPGRVGLREILRQALRNFLFGTGLMVACVVIFYLFFNWLSAPPAA